MKRGGISNFLRKLGLIYFVDSVRFRMQKKKHRLANEEFLKANPGVLLPPDYLMYESYQMNYKKYFEDGLQTAKWLESYWSKYIDLKGAKVLDWGCGPGRVIRHLPDLLDADAQVFGTDYNADTIAWCYDNLKGISFNKNELTAELPYESDFFNVIYGISIFTHLSEELHFEWFEELYRVLKPGGIMFVTLQGDVFKEKMTAAEITSYTNGNLVVRGKVKEGHRTYSAFHPLQFTEKLFQNVTVLEHVAGKKVSQSYLEQDVWIVQK